jgi:hypothetical protein
MVQSGILLKEAGGWFPVFEDNHMIAGDTRSQNPKESSHPSDAVSVCMIEELAQLGMASLWEGAEPCLMERDESVVIDSNVDFAVTDAVLR